MIVIIFESESDETLGKLRELWAELDRDEEAAEQFCELLSAEGAQAYFGKMAAMH